DGFVVNTILKEADLFCPNSVRINFTIYQKISHTRRSPKDRNYPSTPFGKLPKIKGRRLEILAPFQYNLFIGMQS
ncbi:hypothetical protein WN870_15910, partial [Lactiplantibacillus plantarum]